MTEINFRNVKMIGLNNTNTAYGQTILYTTKLIFGTNCYGKLISEVTLPTKEEVEASSKLDVSFGIKFDETDIPDEFYDEDFAVTAKNTNFRTQLGYFQKKIEERNKMFNRVMALRPSFKMDSDDLEDSIKARDLVISHAREFTKSLIGQKNCEQILMTMTILLPVLKHLVPYKDVVEDEEYNPNKAFETIVPCFVPCEPSPKIGKSWWKCLGYNSDCGCAKLAHNAEFGMREMNRVRDLRRTGKYQEALDGLLLVRNSNLFNDKKINGECRKMIDELIALTSNEQKEQTPEPPKKKEVKHSKETLTRSANKARDAKKKEQEEYLKRVAEAERQRAEEEERKRRAKKTAKKVIV
jgi:hypothetical protein